MNENKARILVMRHGERVDHNVSDWIEKSFDADGNYHPKDLNMPETLIKHPRGPKVNGNAFVVRKSILFRHRFNFQGWLKDSPLSNVGVLQATLVGKALRRAGVNIDKAYASPAFRSISTCSSVLEGLQQKDQTQINVDSGLFEWCGWHVAAGVSAIQWLESDDLIRSGVNVNETYQSSFDRCEMVHCLNESAEEFQERCGKFVKDLASDVKGGETILLVAHGPTGVVCSQALCGRPLLNGVDLTALMTKVPYCSLTIFEKDLLKGGDWVVADESYPMTHLSNDTWDYRVMFQ